MFVVFLLDGRFLSVIILDALSPGVSRRLLGCQEEKNKQKGLVGEMTTIYGKDNYILRQKRQLHTTVKAITLQKVT